MTDLGAELGVGDCLLLLLGLRRKIGDITDALRELVDALDENDTGMPAESNETASAWFKRSNARVKAARARCAEILNARGGNKEVEHGSSNT